MPTPTYQHLPEEKQRRIMEASFDEFAAHRFSDASINRIVKAAGISRGSFYQYFKDKEDLYLLVMETISKEKLEVYARHPAPSEDSIFFEAVIASLPAILEWAERQPRYNQIGMRMAQDDSEFMSRILGRMEYPTRRIADFLRQDQQRGLVRRDINPELVLQLILPITMALLRDYYSEGGRETALNKIQQVFDIFGNGISEKG